VEALQEMPEDYDPRFVEILGPTISPISFGRYRAGIPGSHRVL